MNYVTKKPKGMSRAEAFEILGIDILAETITPESLDILVKGLRQKHHPDKGGSIDKAAEVL